MNDWLQGIVQKRGAEVGLILQQLLIMGRAKGKVTAEDAHNIKVSHPNVRGAAMKLLYKCGFVKDTPIQGTTKASHGHWLWVWKLQDDMQAQSVCNDITETILKIPVKQDNQMRLI